MPRLRARRSSRRSFTGRTPYGRYNGIKVGMYINIADGLPWDRGHGACFSVAGVRQSGTVRLMWYLFSDLGGRDSHVYTIIKAIIHVNALVVVQCVQLLVCRAVIVQLPNLRGRRHSVSFAPPHHPM